MEPTPGATIALAETRTDRGFESSAPARRAEGGVVPPGPVLFEWGPLRVLEHVGEGSGGAVYRAFDPALQMEVALKLKKPDPGWSNMGRKRFLDEASRLARVRHPNVLVIHGADEHDGQMGIWTDLIRGCSLEEYIGRQGPLSACEATMVGIDLCRALAAVHARRLIHRDVKTSNVMREEGGRILLMDFGCVAELAPSGTAGSDGMTVGTPLAMAPEQLRGEPASVRSDVYSLGVLLYRLVTCRYPVEDHTRSGLLRAHERSGAVPLLDRRPDLPLEFVRVVERALSGDPGARHPSPGAMERALSASIGGGAFATARPARPLPFQWGLVLGTGAVLVGLALASWGRNPPRIERGSSADPYRPSATNVRERLPASVISAVPLQAKAALFRHSGTRNVPLRPGSPVRPGDGLYLELSPAEPMNTYVLNEDESGSVFVLFPLEGAGPRNPLGAAASHRLPGKAGDSLLYWTVTSEGGRERITVIGSRSPLTALEDVIAHVPAVGLGAPIRLGPARRGIGGMRKERATGDARRRVDDMIRSLEGRRREAGDVWIWRVELNDPARYTKDANTAR